MISGHYCPNGTKFDTEFRCPPGSYNPVTKATAPTDCIDCPGGQYCQGYANSAPTGNCSAGWYCSGGAEMPNDTAHGGECQPGYYCPEGKWGRNAERYSARRGVPARILLPWGEVGQKCRTIQRTVGSASQDITALRVSGAEMLNDTAHGGSASQDITALRVSGAEMPNDTATRRGVPARILLPRG